MQFPCFKELSMKQISALPDDPIRSELRRVSFLSDHPRALTFFRELGSGSEYPQRISGALACGEGRAGRPCRTRSGCVTLMPRPRGSGYSLSDRLGARKTRAPTGSLVRGANSNSPQAHLAGPARP